MKTSITLVLRVLSVTTLLIYTVHIFAQESNYQLVKVGNRVSLQIPSHWYIHNLDERRNISASGESLVDLAGRQDEPVFVSALSVQSRPEPVGGIIRVSYIPTKMPNEQFYQSDIKEAINSEPVEFIRDLSEDFSQMIVDLARVMKNQGIKILDHGPANIESINGVFALTYSYRRTSAYGQTPFTVTQYHIPLGNEKVLITLSYRIADAPLFRPILDRVKRSIIIK